MVDKLQGPDQNRIVPTYVRTIMDEPVPPVAEESPMTVLLKTTPMSSKSQIDSGGRISRGAFVVGGLATLGGAFGLGWFTGQKDSGNSLETPTPQSRPTSTKGSEKKTEVTPTVGTEVKVVKGPDYKDIVDSELQVDFNQTVKDFIVLAENKNNASITVSGSSLPWARPRLIQIGSKVPLNPDPFLEMRTKLGFEHPDEWEKYYELFTTTPAERVLDIRVPKNEIFVFNLETGVSFDPRMASGDSEQVARAGYLVFCVPTKTIDDIVPDGLSVVVDTEQERPPFRRVYKVSPGVKYRSLVSTGANAEGPIVGKIGFGKSDLIFFDVSGKSDGNAVFLDAKKNNLVSDLRGIHKQGIGFVTDFYFIAVARGAIGINHPWSMREWAFDPNSAWGSGIPGMTFTFWKDGNKKLDVVYKP